MEPGLEHPGTQRTRTGKSGGRRPWTGTSGDEAARDWNVRGTKKGKKTATERNGEENMNKTKEEEGHHEQETRSGRRKRRRRSGQTHGTRMGGNRGSNAPGLHHPGAGRPWMGASGAP